MFSGGGRWRKTCYIMCEMIKLEFSCIAIILSTVLQKNVR